MKLAALSDLHIGGRATEGCFGHQEDEFLLFLDGLEAAHDHVVLVGDVFQTDQSGRVGRRAAARNLARAKRRLPKLWDRLTSDRYTMVSGNHDEATATVLRAPETHRVDHGDFGVFFIHGHQFDPLLRRYYPIARASTWVNGRARRLGLDRFAEWLEQKDIAIKGDRFKGPHGPYAEGGQQMLRHHGVDLVVMGHTHVPEDLTFPEGRVMNSGSCSRGRRMYISIDFEQGTAEFVGDDARGE